MVELGLLILFGFAVVMACTLLALIKAVFWLVLLPFRVLFWTVAGMLALPVLILGAVAGAGLIVLALPLLLVSFLGALALALLVPLLPFLLLAGLIWLLAAAPRRAAVPQ